MSLANVTRSWHCSVTSQRVKEGQQRPPWLFKKEDSMPVGTGVCSAVKAQQAWEVTCFDDHLHTSPLHFNSSARLVCLLPLGISEKQWIRPQPSWVNHTSVRMHHVMFRGLVTLRKRKARKEMNQRIAGCGTQIAWAWVEDRRRYGDCSLTCTSSVNVKLPHVILSALLLGSQIFSSIYIYTHSYIGQGTIFGNFSTHPKSLLHASLWGRRTTWISPSQ